GDGTAKVYLIYLDYGLGLPVGTPYSRYLLGIKIGRAVRFALLDGKREDKSVINPIYSFIFMCRLST
ncbi:MAG: hypothetical protein AL399_05220, partial [Candidatus [Bacteroides] periocalifornicus]